MSALPTVTVAVPVLNEECHIAACLDAVARQTYEGSIEVLVADGGSSDRTRELVAARPAVRLLDNPGRIQSAGLNVVLREAKGEVFIRVDGHCVIAPDYVENCVDALTETRAAMVGGGMTPTASGWLQEGIAAAMASPLGAGPARFHVGGEPGWVDTVYLGAFRTADARAVGGYAEDVGVNEDAELARRLGARGGVWYTPAIKSTYVPRSSLSALARQFFRYGESRAATVVKHPRSLRPRQLFAPALVLGLATKARRGTMVAYPAVVAIAAALQWRRDRRAVPGLVVSLPVMHLPWGIGFLRGVVVRIVRKRSA